MNRLTVDELTQEVSRTWVPTGQLRWFALRSLFAPRPVLQQEMRCNETHERVWRDVPVVRR